MIKEANASAAAGNHAVRGAIDDYLARRIMRASEGWRPATTRDADGTSTLTMRSDAETLPEWKEASAEFDDAESWAAEGADGFLFNFGEPLYAHVVEMAWRVGPEDAVAAVAYGTLLLVTDPIPAQYVIDGLREMDVDGAEVLENLEEDLLMAPVFILRGVEVVEDRRGSGAWAALRARMVEDVTAETGGPIPLVIVDMDHMLDDGIGDLDDDHEMRADAIEAAIESFKDADPRFAEAIIENYLEDCDFDMAEWPVPANGGGHDVPDIIPSAGNARVAIGHSASFPPIAPTTVDGAIAILDDWRRSPEIDRADIRRALASLIPVVAMEQRKDWRRDVDRLLDAIASLDQRITSADRLETKAAQPFTLANPKGDICGAIFNRGMLATANGWGSMEGRQHDAMITEAAYEGISALMRQREDRDPPTPEVVDPEIYTALLIRTAIHLAQEARS